MKDLIGTRMKENYENRSKTFLLRRTPAIIRVDGKAFHTFTKGFEKPYDNRIIDTMKYTAIALCEELQGAKIAYVQSDEISILLTDFDDLATNAWFDYNVQKLTSVSASVATLNFNKFFRNQVLLSEQRIDAPDTTFERSKFDSALFDSRAFSIPKEEVCNYFIWRQQDATKNAIQGLGQKYFSHKQMQNKNTSEIQEMLFQEKQINFNDCPIYFKRGFCIIKQTLNDRTKWVEDIQIPIFSKERNYIEQYLQTEI